MAGHPIRLPVRAFVQGTSWLGPQFRVDMHRSANAPLLAVPALLRELHDVLVVQSDYEARKHTQSLVPTTCLETIHVVRPASLSPRLGSFANGGTWAASSASHG